MLLDFWNNKKHVIQIVGALVAIGALFLTIPVPSNTQAKNALLSVQFCWLLIITLSLLSLAYQFYLFACSIEKLWSDKTKLDSNILTGFISVISMFILFNLWEYMFCLYSDQFRHLANNLTIVVNGFCIVVWLRFLGFLYNKFLKVSYLFVLSQIGFSILLSLLSGLWIQFANLSYQCWNLVSCFLLYFSVALIGLIILLIVDFISEKKFDQSLFKNW